jgi:acetylornithine deacetylase/succinyl-diaminopimelate desuccinylase-like protein
MATEELRALACIKMKKFVFVAIIVMVAAARGRAEPEAVGKQTRAWRTQHEREILAEFAELVAIPNVNGDQPNIARNVKAIRAMLEKRGLTTQLLTIEGASPVVVADLKVPASHRTIAFYAHYDGQPVDASKWTSDPWKPVMRDANGKEVDWRHAKAIDPEWRLYARSSGDDKLPIIGMLAALDALHSAGMKPSVNLRFVLEGEEEAGSPHLADYLAKYPAVLRPTVWILCDGPVHQSRRMQLYFGARGTLGLDLTTFGPVKGLHDGHYGNWVPNPIVRLTHLLDSMRDENGRILIAGFYDGLQAPTEAERKALAAIPDVEPALRREFQIASTEGGAKPLNELLMLPALNVRGIESGHVGSNASNTIQTEARASIDFRLVPPQTTESVKKLVERHLESLGYKIVREKPAAALRLAQDKIVQVEWEAGYPAARTALDLPISMEVAEIMTAAGHEPIRLPTMGGSIPMYLFQQPNDTPVIGLPMANHDDNQHAADENLRLQNLWDGIEVFACLFTHLAAD